MYKRSTTSCAVWRCCGSCLRQPQTTSSKVNRPCTLSLTRVSCGHWGSPTCKGTARLGACHNIRRAQAGQGPYCHKQDVLEGIANVFCIHSWHSLHSESPGDSSQAQPTGSGQMPGCGCHCRRICRRPQHVCAPDFLCRQPCPTATARRPTCHAQAWGDSSRPCTAGQPSQALPCLADTCNTNTLLKQLLAGPQPCKGRTTGSCAVSQQIPKPSSVKHAKF